MPLKQPARREWDDITDGNRAIDREYITIREHVLKGNLLPVWIETVRNCSDLGTKSGIATILMHDGMKKGYGTRT